ncbi:MAG: CYTH domain-containing protein [Gammaproteobacteria bacterium]|nr:CYTH domain-containing protein [Gammaproteobacteria bacterium]
MNNHLEIERKFLVDKQKWQKPATGTLIRQGFLATNKRLACRIRQKGTSYFLCIKARVDDITRHEFEYEVPEDHGRIMLEQHCERVPIEKVRYEVEHEGMIWEVDDFQGLNSGLIVAEIELQNPDQLFARPKWATTEVSDDPRYLNTHLYEHPYTQWPSN